MSAGDFLAQRWLTHDFCSARTVAEPPKGVPLCRLRLSEAEAGRAREILTGYVRTGLRTERHLAALFCLFAADAVRRHHAGGPWTWDTIAAALEMPGGLDETAMRDLVERGLAFWQRPLRKDARGRRFLGSLVLEGGIPASLMGRADFSYFLRQLQRDLDQFGAQSAAAAELFAEQRSSQLPPAWRQADTLALAAELLIELKRWRQLLPPSASGQVAVSLLNSAHPEWRRDLPLDLGDEAAARLIGSLLEAPRVGPPPLKVLPALCRRVLVRTKAGWRHAVCALGPGLLPADLISMPPFGVQDPPDRVRFLVDGAAAREMAVAEREAEGRWRFRPMAGTPVPATAEAVSVRLVVDGGERARVPLPGGAALADLPWVLEEGDAVGGEASLLLHAGYGSRTVEGDRVFLAVAPGSGSLTVLSGEARAVGEVEATGRLVYEVAGRAVWRDAGDSIGISLATGGRQARAASLSIDARRPDWTVLAPLVSLGAPRVGSSSAGPSSRVLVRRAGAGNVWNAVRPESWRPGTIDVALVDGNEILDRWRLLVLPACARMDLVVRDGRRAVVSAEGMPQVLLAVEGHAGRALERTEDGARVEVDFADLPPSDLTVVTRLGGSSDPTEVRHRFRVPLSAGGFSGPDGRQMRAGARCTLSHLDTIVARAADGGEQPAELAARLAGVAEGLLQGVRLGLSAAFIGDMPLSRIRRTLRRLCTTARSQDAELQLEVLRGGIPGRPLRIAACDFQLHLDGTSMRASLMGFDGRPAEPKDGDGLAVLSLPRPADALRSLHDGGAGWVLPGPDEPGPWLVVGEGSLAGRVRPRVWDAAPPRASEVAGLASIIAQSDRQARSAGLAERLREVAAEPYAEHAEGDWQILDATLDRAGSLAPALSFDLLEAAAAVPELLPHWLLRADQERLSRLAGAEDELPIAWAMVPLSAWRAAGAAFLERWTAVAGSVLAREVLARRLEEACLLCPPVAGAAWYVREAFELDHAPGEPRLGALLQPALTAALDAWIGPVLDDASWAAGVFAESDWQNLPAALRVSAASFAARRAVDGCSVPPRLVAAVRFCRHAAEDEFDRRFRWALQREIARSPRHLETEAHA
ncbi:STY4851/ECs_5259 family protein [Roseomonas sp. SSH11]|uniref:STY4851/ECs_5259 family protein n=1 Tax=Pararoseomonas baculiformis TaxID=2820812 RepID=A0ABS4AKD0_9PROT|nr:STY4851/ECs_5259 family protein [Pararoseomonas baculiformis]MBP0447319.1 STY4851/ECs_5259 family protein [Pararoseomonas baculiformis]